MAIEEFPALEQVVILHSGGVDPAVLAKAAGIKSPVSITSFTDGGTHEKEVLKSTASRSDHLLIQQSLWRITEDALSAERAQAIMYHPHTLRVFENGAVSAIVTAAGYDRVELETYIKKQITNGQDAMK